MKTLSFILAMFFILVSFVACNKTDDTPEVTTTVATTTAAVTTTSSTTTTTTTQASNKYSIIGGKTLPNDLAKELDEFFMSIDSERWEFDIYKTAPMYRVEYFGEHKYDVHPKSYKTINDVINYRHCDLTDSETEALHAILERAMNS